jgi:ribokinase
MVGLVGTDGDGADYVENFKSNGVDVRFVRRIEKESTGLAMIMVDKSAHNSIVICPNVTTKFTIPFLDDSLHGWLQGTDILICQNEIPLDTTLYALKVASAAGVYTIFNPAPAPQNEEDLNKVKAHLRYVSMFCPNETEASQICGFEIKDIETAKRGAKKMLTDGTGCKAVIITLGSQGAVFMERGGEVMHEAATKMKAVDTTGAGDCFVGTMANFLASGESLRASVRKANFCAGVSVTKKGTQLSYPFKDELPKELFAVKKE